MPTLTQQGNCVFLIDKIGPDLVDAPVLVVGRVVVTPTSDREPTQDPMTGFRCGDTPLGRGHIIALFLGGPDIPENYAPQYEQWQQGGAWKNMELALRQMAQQTPADLYMMVRLTYGRTGNEYHAEQLAFSNGEINDWNDARIPSRFEVWTFTSGDRRAAGVIASLCSTTAATVGAAMSALPDAYFLQLIADFDVVQMPVEDYEFWLRNRIRSWARESEEAARQAYEEELEFKMTAALINTRMAEKKESRTVKKGIGKTKARPNVSPQRKQRLTRNQISALQTTLQRKHGFNEKLSSSAWVLDNTSQVAAYIQSQLATSNFGIRPPEQRLLNSAAAGQFVAQRLL